MKTLKWSKKNSIFDIYYKAPINKTSWYEIIGNYGQLHVNYRWNKVGDGANNVELKRVPFLKENIDYLKQIAQKHYESLEK